MARIVSALFCVTSPRLTRLVSACSMVMTTGCSGVCVSYTNNEFAVL